MRLLFMLPLGSGRATPHLPPAGLAMSQTQVATSVPEADKHLLCHEYQWRPETSYLYPHPEFCQQEPQMGVPFDTTEQLNKSEPEIQFREKRGGNLKAKQAYGAGFLGAGIASGWLCSFDLGFGSSRRIESPQVHVNFIEATTNEFLHGGHGLN